MTGTFVLSKLQFQQNILSLKTASPVDLWMRLICRKKKKKKKKWNVTFLYIKWSTREKSKPEYS